MGVSADELRKIYRSAFSRYEPDREVPDTNVRYYPYVNVNHTIRVREGKVFVRVSILFREAPKTVHAALADILVGKLLGRRVPRRSESAYREFVSDPEFREVAVEHKRSRGRKITVSPQGNAYDLERIFERLNRDYFGGDLHQPSLGWSSKKTFRRLGHYDEVHDTIVISRSLDSVSIPAFVVEYVVYHEMLHVKHPTIHRNGRRYSHTAAFRRDEQRYDYFEEAEDWIERNAADLKQIAYGKKPAGRKRYWGLFD